MKAGASSFEKDLTFATFFEVGPEKTANAGAFMPLRWNHHTKLPASTKQEKC